MTRASLARRVAVIGMLTAGFYLLVLVVAAAAVAAPFLEWRYLGRLHLQILVLPLIALALLASVIPRRDRFEPPGPELTATAQPALWHEIEQIAAATGQKPPAQVFLLPEVNAFVAQRGGVAGIGSRRVLGVGLPLMQALTVEQLRSVLAHEFGHYAGGDTRLGAWLYQTRAAIARTVEAGGGDGLGAMFSGYHRFFLRHTQSISREQELVADELAAATTSPSVVADALTRVRVAAEAWGGFVGGSLEPVVMSGRRASLVHGFDRMLTATVSSGTHDAITHDQTQREAHPYDSHPPLGERLAHLGQLAAPPRREDPDGSARSIRLLRGLAALDTETLDMMLADIDGSSLRPVDWDDIVADVWVPAWTERIEARVDGLGDLTLATLPRTEDVWRDLGERILGDDTAALSHVHWGAYAADTVATAATLMFHRYKWQVEAPIGGRVTCRSGTQVIEPFAWLDGVFSGAVDRNWFDTMVRATGLADAPLHYAVWNGAAQVTATASPAAEPAEGPDDVLVAMPLGSEDGPGLRLTATELSTDVLRIALSEVTGFAYKLTVNRQLGVEIRSYRLTLVTAGGPETISLRATSKAKVGVVEPAFERLITELHRRVGPRVHGQLRARVMAGEPVSIGDLTLSTATLAVGRRKSFEWAALVGAGVHDGSVQVWMDTGKPDPKLVATVGLDVPNAPLLPDLLGDLQSALPAPA